MTDVEERWWEADEEMVEVDLRVMAAAAVAVAAAAVTKRRSEMRCVWAAGLAMLWARV